jgi:hypothetical protein
MCTVLSLAMMRKVTPTNVMDDADEVDSDAFYVII